MTNEELVTAIQAGKTDLIETLWDQNKRFVCGIARGWKRAFENHSDFDVEDLIQQGWFALLDTVKYFQPEKEGSSFLQLFKLCLKRQFQIAIGIYTSKRDAAFMASVRLDSPLNADEPDGLTLGDALPDSASEAPFEALETSSMRSVMDSVAYDILTEQQQEIYTNLLNGRGCPIQYQREKVLGILRNDPRILQLWLDLTDQRETVGDVIDRFMQQVGTRSFNEIGASSVEMSVLRMIQNEGTHQKKRATMERVLSEKLHTARQILQQERKKQQQKQIRSDLAAFEQIRQNLTVAAEQR